ncbi:MAG: Maf family protein [Anaerolineae bacterium]
MCANLLVLASASPRRRALLMRLGLEHTVVPPALDESAYRGATPQETTALIAAAKALSLDSRGSIVVAADTAVVLEGEMLGKPANAAEATAMLRRLRGRWHRVLTALAVRGAEGVMHLDVVATDVLMRPYSEGEIAAQVASGEALDKAGAYGVQQPGFRPVARIRGCYQTVVGLPLCHLCRRLEQEGVVLPSTPPPHCRRDLHQACPVALYPQT